MSLSHPEEEAHLDWQRLQQSVLIVRHRNGTSRLYPCKECGDYCQVCRSRQECCLNQTRTEEEAS